MKLLMHNDPSLTEAEIKISYPEMNCRLDRLIKYIKQYSFIFQAKTETGLCFIPAEQIYYIDSADSKTFLYAKDKVYGCAESLSALEYMLEDSSFVRISKNCIVNINFLKSVNPLWNHRLEAILSNGEKLVVTRHYIDGLKEKILN